MTYCSKCGSVNPDDSAFCANCGAQLKQQTAQGTVNNYYYGRQRRRDRRESGQGRRGGMMAPFVFAGIFIVIGMAVFLPNLPWQYFWGILWLMLGGLIVGFWALRRSQGKTAQTQQTIS